MPAAIASASSGHLQDPRQRAKCPLPSILQQRCRACVVEELFTQRVHLTAYMRPVCALLSPVPCFTKQGLARLVVWLFHSTLK